LVRLDTKVIEETISLGKTDTNNAMAALTRAEADLAKAEIAVDAYLDGEFRSRMQGLERDLEQKQRNLRVAEKMLSHSNDMFQRGYVTELEVEGNESAVTRAKLELGVVKNQIDVLGRLTKAMQLETLNGQLIAARARVAGRKAGVTLEQGRLDLAEMELERHTIRAPRDGLVIYPSTAKWKDTPDITEGASVHNHQVMLIMPDLNKMQVVIGVHESIIDRVKVGMPVTVTLPDRTLQTEVASVAAIASPAGWWTDNTVRYDVTIDLPAEEGLRPGMSAEVEIVMDRYGNVVSIPVEAVVETPEGHFCWVESGEQTERRQLAIGDSNDEAIVVLEGLAEGERVVLDPLDFVPDARDLIAPTLVHTTVKGDMAVSLIEQGSLESSNNTLIKCRVRGASTVNSVIESGVEVKKGDELIRLENKQIEDFVHERTKFAYLSEDAAIGARAQANRAELAIQEYLEGRYITELMTLEKDLAIAEERLRTAQNILRHAKTMFDRGYISETEVDQKEFVVNETKMDVEIKDTEIEVLKEFSKAQQLATLKGDWESAKAEADGHEEVLKMDRARIAQAKEELQRSVITAPRDGLVIYPTGEAWKNAPEMDIGVTVHHDQVLLLMPDVSQMQVRVGIHESMADLISPGMSATVAVPGKTLQGKVASVAAAARPSGWWTGNMVKYDAIIELPTAEGLKPGMSAEVEILLERHRDVLQIPLTSVVEEADGAFCYVGTPDNAKRRPIQLGDNNETHVIVRSGLQEGEKILLQPPESQPET